MNSRVHTVCWQLSSTLLRTSQLSSLHFSIIATPSAAANLGDVNTALFSVIVSYSCLYQLHSQHPLHVGPLRSSSVQIHLQSRVGSSYYDCTSSLFTFDDFLLFPPPCCLNAWPGLCYGFWGVLHISHPCSLTRHQCHHVHTKDRN